MFQLAKYYPDGIPFDGHYQLLRPLSHDGATADVWLALDLNTVDVVTKEDENGDVHEEKDLDSGLKVAIKIFRPKSVLDVAGEQRFRDEYKIVFNCRHTNLVKPTGFSIFEGVPYLVLPFCSKGSSETLTGKLTETSEIWRYIGDVAAGLAYLHNNEPVIIHQDIKPGNILIDDNGHFAITDFGISTRSRKGQHHYYYDDEHHGGTLAYMGPERFSEEAEPMRESDIWAFGATLYELICGKVPYGEEGGNNQVNGAPAPEFPTGIPDSIKRLIIACLAADPAQRPTADIICRAAEQQQYPVRKKSMLPAVIGGAILSAGLVLGGFFMFHTEPVIPVSTPPEQIYEEALYRMDHWHDADSLRFGIEQMDSLAKLSFVPAIYQLAFTYGWYSDPISLERKRLLDIPIYHDGDHRYFPKNEAVTLRAISHFLNITQIDDSIHHELTIEACHRLAAYYWNFENDSKKAIKYLNMGRQHAIEVGDDSITTNFDNLLQIVKDGE